MCTLLAIVLNAEAELNNAQPVFLPSTSVICLTLSVILSAISVSYTHLCPAQHGALRILFQPLADLVLITAQNIRKQQLVAVAIHVQRFVDAGFLTAVGAFA